jgi:hypothetical protein
VLDVTRLAPLPSVLPAVKTLPRVHARAEIGVAIQARALIDALSGAVTVAAVRVAFERVVRLRERARRKKLRVKGALEAEHEEERE